MSDDDRTLHDIAGSDMDRRQFLKSAAASTAAAAAPAALRAAPADGSASTLGFDEAPASFDEQLHVPKGYEAEVLLRWGDPLFSEGDALPVERLDAAAQRRCFGYNSDYLAFLPLPFGSENSEHGLLCVNHEYTNPELIWPGFEPDDPRGPVTADQVAVQMAAHGHSVLEVALENGTWRPVRDSSYTRRISLDRTEMQLTGPAAGHERLQTQQDPTGTRVTGTLANCAGGVTPWGTILIAEENFDDYFGGEPSEARLERNLEALDYYSVGYYGFDKHRERFDIEEHPNEINRFGWIVEYDPRRPDSTPKKRTALGRFKHECATVTMNSDGRIVLYSGDDEEHEHLYKWVSRREYDPTDRRSNFSLLDEGVLYAAEFHGDGRVEWHPLVHGEGPLTPSNGFQSQADVLIETRRAARLLDATPLDRPEDVETNPQTGRVYVTLTNNLERSETGPASPRAPNVHGHVVELIPPYGARNHAADTFRWRYFVLGGDPDVSDSDTRYHEDVSDAGWLTCPDNITFDSRGRIWLTSDQSDLQEETGVADGLFSADTRGSGRALTRRLVSVPVGAEPSGPFFTPDDRTLFLCIQHPGERSTIDDPSTRWPDFNDDQPPRPSVVAIRRRDGRPIGS